MGEGERGWDWVWVELEEVNLTKTVRTSLRTNKTRTERKTEYSAVSATPAPPVRFSPVSTRTALPATRGRSFSGEPQLQNRQMGIQATSENCLLAGSLQASEG